MNRIAFLFAAVALAAFATRAGAEVQGWRTPEGGLYYGSEPPPGSTRIDHARPTPTRGATPVPETRPSPTAKPMATARPTRPPAPTEVPTRGPAPAARPTIAHPRPTTAPRATPTAASPGQESSEPSAGWSREGACGELVAIRDTRPTIDFDRNVVVVSGEAVVIAGGSVKDLEICLSGTCVPVAPGKVLREGDTKRFSIAAPRGRPTGFTVKCSVLQ